MKWYIIGAVGGVLVVAALIVCYFVFWHKPAEEADPSPSGRYKVTAMKVAGDPWKLVDAPSGSGDGAGEVEQAIQRFYQKQQEIVQERQDGRLPAGADDLKVQIGKLFDEFDTLAATTAVPLACADLLVASADKGGFELEPYLRKTAMEWRRPFELTVALQGIGRAALIEGRVAEKQGNQAKADGIYRAVLIYGVRLAGNTARVWVQLEGLGSQADAATAIAVSAPGGKAAAAREYRQAVMTARGRASDVFNHLFQSVPKWHAGDLLLFARQHSDPAWRVEALLSMGLCRLSANGRQYATQLDRCLAEAIKDSDPNVSAAARWADTVTKDIYGEQTRRN